ncbi:MAG: molecular chaperone DnaJ [Planctomycetota bacterium]|jgi:molecular chaperone DnaJ
MASQRDYYEILGVDKNAGDEEIKKAYRKIALENHPDRNPDDSAAEARFKEAADAYAILSDKEKRQRYDQYGHAGVDGMGGGGGFSNVEDIFAHFGDLFGGGRGGGIFERFFGGGRSRSRRGSSLRVDLQLSLEDVARGVKKTIEISRSEACTNCSGSGAKPGTHPKSCSTCGGHGEVINSQGFLSIRQTCPSCRGQGTVIESPCPNCRGRGVTPKKAPISITIPAGIEEGHVERIVGQGEPGDKGGPPGDLVVVIHVEPHQIFTRHGDDLLAQITTRYRQAVLGDSVELPTITGETVVLKIPPGTQPGDRLRIRNHGLPRVDGYGKGNLVVQVQVTVPKKLSSEQQELLLKLDELEQANQKKNKKKGIFEKVKDIFQ